MSSKTQVLILGATGYIGGSILAELLRSSEASKLSISALIRRSDQMAKLNSLGVKPILFGGLDDLEACIDAASQSDLVINAASASHDRSAKALVEGLALRQKATGKEAYLIHTSGTSILGDHPYTGTPQDQKIWSDEKDNIFEMEKNHPERYGQRVTDVTVVETGLSLGVKTYIVVPPTIYGQGDGPFATLSQQVPNLARLARKRGFAGVIESGKGIWNHVHIADLSVFYGLLFRAVIEQNTWLPSGPDAVFFVESGEHTWLQVSQGIADAMCKSGLLATNEVKSISLKEAAAEITGGNESLAEISLASNSRARADFARNRLGWNTPRGSEDFLNHFDAEVAAMLGELRG
ncbi:hypothetical protein N7491_006863 [Penicillium cf. griseofulvum]|uniref:NAD-dependent epimerase/dehydratase domain-containing protein n=1 Tax=Penicillium cf. griseofulvum TaxID=2972120 RepID=A0A9W9J0H3_9EURO|nr:hypothetical protein N7472_010106 [Penicillium cf. griseofulvum]KAJ5429847.1 hypothetical protein N7491_006863 [Penicillium cf. griseofulvum]KAJ5436383.1 hypothetical protein N7445_007268 [Penicillium cf. griseofulvum]